MTNAKAKPYRLPQVWVSCDRWPDPGRLKTFVRDIFRIERPRTDEQRALAVYRWITRTFMWGGQTVEGPPNMWAVEPDLIKTLNVHGYGYCDGWGRLFSALWQAAGREAYKIVIYNDTPVPAHTLSEIWYNDADVVYIDEQYRDVDGGFASGLVVHEFTHYLQDKSGDFESLSCDDSIAREREAYYVQNRYIIEALARIDTILPSHTTCNYANAGVDTQGD